MQHASAAWFPLGGRFGNLESLLASLRRAPVRARSSDGDMAAAAPVVKHGEERTCLNRFRTCALGDWGSDTFRLTCCLWESCCSAARRGPDLQRSQGKRTGGNAEGGPFACVRLAWGPWPALASAGGLQVRPGSPGSPARPTSSCSSSRRTARRVARRRLGARGRPPTPPVRSASSTRQRSHSQHSRSAGERRTGRAAGRAAGRGRDGRVRHKFGGDSFLVVCQLRCP